MTVQTVSAASGAEALSNAVRTRYINEYWRAASMQRLYDQLAMPVGAAQFDLETRRGMGSTYTFNFASDLNPGTTAISESIDLQDHQI